MDKLIVGIDRCGQLAWLGEEDSAGIPVGYIDDQRQCWISVLEHDLTVSAQQIHRQLEVEAQRHSWAVMGRIAEHCCQHADNHYQGIISGVAAIGYSRRLGRQLEDPLLGKFLVDSILSRQQFANEQEIERGWQRWREDRG